VAVAGRDIVFNVCPNCGEYRVDKVVDESVERLLSWAGKIYG